MTPLDPTVKRTESIVATCCHKQCEDQDGWDGLLLYVGDAWNTSLVNAGTPLGATAVVTPGSAGYLLWECMHPTSGTRLPQLKVVREAA